MRAMEWTVKQLEKDSTCCGNPLRCRSEMLINFKVFRSCVGVSVIEEQ